MPINRAWHQAHRMPKKATPEERWAWHIEHQRACGCRPIPAKLRERMMGEMKAKGKGGQ